MRPAWYPKATKSWGWVSGASSDKSTTTTSSEDKHFLAFIREKDDCALRLFKIGFIAFQSDGALCSTTLGTPCLIQNMQSLTSLYEWRCYFAKVGVPPLDPTPLSS